MSSTRSFRRAREALLKPGATVGRGLTAAIGLRRDALEQIVVLVQGFARLAIVVAGAMVVLARWNVSQDFASTLRNAYFGFTHRRSDAVAVVAADRRRGARDRHDRPPALCRTG